MEKCVSGSVETVYVDGNTKKNYESEDLSVKPLQFSVLASLGVQANFNKYFIHNLHKFRRDLCNLSFVYACAFGKIVLP